ncbi:MAG: beta-lactamase family protein [Alphaproteobacteria bacterium]|uniref:Beta-lactamase family protein n=1 Tax=Brevundimonas mediterranea TaxID=74329 RepID=A0AB37E9N3_9CAUL|nr:beta-lactamase [Brevundimonas sp. BAL3]MBA4332496.1 serine hydrolase [Brevundimonas sp.]MBU4196995.1 beta-lactamase family protein [Alphaproteobacteria bacterium]OGN41274.1 MAG: serine hydrolase [Caulobacterales bacterium GWE1_67_11]OGN48424.1 MAG: serine hydrolase [Caulobacterales bacterium RIFCSPHIGHO2_12_FULL_68_13]QIH74170.1 beta-lactamase family protein [Brevundimonas mediterranea]
MFEVPRTPGGHPRLVLGVLGALILGGAVWAGFSTAVKPASDAVLASIRPDTPPRPPLVVVEDLPQLAARLDREAAAGRFMGAVLVAKGDRVLFRQVYGEANYEQDRPLKLDSRFRLASISKQFTATAILRLQDEGRLRISDPVCKWIQPCPKAWEPVRISHLLSHTSGIPDLMARPGWGMRRTTPATLNELTEDSKRFGLQFAPGTKVRYDNAGFNLAAAIVEQASGRPYDAYMRETFFGPLGMKDSGLDLDGGDHGVIMGYANFPAGLAAQPNANTSIVAGAGAVYSTLDDLLVWQRALHRGALLKPFSYQQMLADHAPADTPKERGRPRRDWGYGIFSNRLGDQVRPSFQDRQIYHTGSWGGFRNLMLYQPEADVTVIVLSNNYHLRDQVFLISQQAMAEALGREFPTTLAR